MMETVTTVRHDYVAKHVERPEVIIPCGNIRTSSAPLDDRTMTRLSYVSPGPIKPVISFKPILKYHPSSQPLSKETTQKLSYQPYVVVEKELHSWTQKPTYKYVEFECYILIIIKSIHNKKVKIQIII